MPYEAWLHGVVTAQVKPELHELLSGLASEPSAEVQDLFLCMASPPSSDVPRSEVLIQRDTKRGTWTVRHQARPLTGDKADKLSAAVREVQEAEIHQGDPSRLFNALGFTAEYQVLHAGEGYRLLVHNHPIVVRLVSLSVRITGQGLVDVKAGHLLLEASCQTTQESYADACAALAALKTKLAHVAELKKPATHLQRLTAASDLMPEKPQLGLKHVLGLSS